ncbi:Mod-A [Cladorrhinum sp. PSN259]|nr:Mod-A [Cladorrhinum sp. PSN259]
MGNNTEVTVAIIALAISVLALLGVVLQYVQASYLKTNGHWLRDKAVMGKWVSHAHLRFGLLRAWVEYEAPVIFLAPTNNKRGPVAGKTIWYVDGSSKSCDETRVDQLSNDRDRERVHTVTKELATWIMVISAAQKMERDSKDWEQMKWRDSGTSPPPPPEVVSLAVAIQPIKRSFDKQPAVNRPFASTAICHMIELCAVLGIYWKEFDRVNDKYRAEGNGYSLLGTRVSDFGLLFTFEKTGWPKFGKNRVIPTGEVKELCFGNVPTFYREKDDDKGWGEPITEQTDLKTLMLGSRTEIADTLNLIRCNEFTTQCYSDEKKKHVHLFPVVFELLGMLGRPLHILKRPFTYLPNPAAFVLNKQAFSPRRLLHEFHIRLKQETEHRSKEGFLDRINSLADGLNDAPQGGLPANQDGDYSPQLLDKLHAAIDHVDEFLKKQNTKSVVLDVLRRHIQEVLLAINTSAKDAEAHASGNFNNYSPTSAPQHHAAPGVSPHLPEEDGGTSSGYPRLFPLDEFSTNQQQQQPENMISFDYLLKVPHEKRESALLDTYFAAIRIRAISLTESTEYHDPQAAEASREVHNINALGLSNTTGFQSQHSTPSLGGAGNFSRRTTYTAGGHVPLSTSVRRGETWGTERTIPAVEYNKLTPIEAKRDTIWFALVFRMICWLLLHDFDKKDLQIPKSELMGSRLPVFIV